MPNNTSTEALVHRYAKAVDSGDLETVWACWDDTLIRQRQAITGPATVHLPHTISVPPGASLITDAAGNCVLRLGRDST